jgi:hypothetical protein
LSNITLLQEGKGHIEIILCNGTPSLYKWKIFSWSLSFIDFCNTTFGLLP